MRSCVKGHTHYWKPKLVSLVERAMGPEPQGTWHRKEQLLEASTSPVTLQVHTLGLIDCSISSVIRQYDFRVSNNTKVQKKGGGIRKEGKREREREGGGETLAFFCKAFKFSHAI